MKIAATETWELLKVRITNCWATLDSDPLSSPRFDIIKNSCISNDPREGGRLAWVNLDSTTNGDDEESTFNFRAFRFASSMTMHFHCNSMLIFFANRYYPARLIQRKPDSINKKN